MFYPRKRNLKVKAIRDRLFVFQWGDFVHQAVMTLAVLVKYVNYYYASCSIRVFLTVYEHVCCGCLGDSAVFVHLRLCDVLDNRLVSVSVNLSHPSFSTVIVSQNRQNDSRQSLSLALSLSHTHTRRYTHTHTHTPCLSISQLGFPLRRK